jgi:hypothetical protein
MAAGPSIETSRTLRPDSGARTVRFCARGTTTAKI